MRAVLFDIDDTLFPTSVFAEQARRRAVDAMVAAGLEVDPDTGYGELMQVVEEFSSNYGRHFDKLVLRLGDKLRAGVHPGIVVASGVCAYHSTKEHIQPYADVVAALESLARTSLLRGVITNGLTVKQSEKLVRLGLHESFSPGAIFISEEIGVAKPHPKIFLVACESLGIRPADALYVGDHPAKDVDPAHAAGLKTCLRLGGKHEQAPGLHRPDFTVSTLEELPAILRTLGAPA